MAKRRRKPAPRPPRPPAPLLPAERFTFARKEDCAILEMHDYERQEKFYLTYDQVRALSAYWMRVTGELLV